MPNVAETLKRELEEMRQARAELREALDRADIIEECERILMEAGECSMNLPRDIERVVGCWCVTKNERDAALARVVELEADTGRLRAHQDTLVKERDDAVLEANHWKNEAKRLNGELFVATYKRKDTT